jgi:hypothetical protein
MTDGILPYGYIRVAHAALRFKAERRVQHLYSRFLLRLREFRRADHALGWERGPGFVAVLERRGQDFLSWQLDHFMSRDSPNDEEPDALALRFPVESVWHAYC